MSHNLEESFRRASQLELSRKELDDDSFSSDEDSFEHFEAKIVTLKWLSLREKQLKIAIYYEQLKKKVKFIKDKNLLSEKIADLQDEVNYLNGKYTNEIQLNETARSIAAGRRRYSEKQRQTINDLLKKEKKLTKQKNAEQKESAAIKDSIFKLNQGIPDSRNIKKRNKDVGNEKYEELQMLRSDTKRVFDRTQLLAKVTQSLVAHHLLMAPSSKNNNLLPPLQDICKRLLDSHLDDPENLRDLLNDIKSVEIET